MVKSPNELRYSFYHHTSKAIIEHLNWTQAHGLCNILKKLGTAHWYLYVTNQSDWVTLASAINSILKVDEGKLRYLPVVPDVLSGDPLQHQLIDSPTEKRLYERFAKSLEVLIDIKGVFKKAKTLDVSIGGMKLDSTFTYDPKNPYVMVFVNTSQGRIEFKCKPIDSGNSEFNKVSCVSCSNLPLWKKIASRD